MRRSRPVTILALSGVTFTLACVAAFAGDEGGSVAGVEWRTVDGSGNNPANPDWGSVGAQLLRLAPADYEDRISSPAGADRPSARVVSNIVCAQPGSIFNEGMASDFLWQWGQFIDHDTTLVDPMEPFDPFNIEVPVGDPFFDPGGEGGKFILLDRSRFDETTGTDPSNPRQQIESITAFVDASQVYGSDEVRAIALRTMDGTGRLKTSEGNLLPFNVDMLPNFGGNDPGLFLAGDVRANEQIGLTSMHTLFMREHNRVAEALGGFPGLSGEEIYQMARAIVGAEIQVITYKEFLPLLLGPDAIPPYSGYDSDANPGIANSFATGAYRVGHTLLSPVLRRLDADGNSVGDVPLQDAFFAIDILINDGGIDPLLRGLASQPAQRVDRFVVDDIRNFLFGQPGEGGFDLASLNMQRGRDHGLSSYADTRIAFGLEEVREFRDISSDLETQKALEEAYGRVEDIDLWIGALSEDHVPGALVGELLQTIIGDQFRRLRDGDRFWYQDYFDGPMLVWLQSVRLAKVIRWNTDIGSEIADDVFHVASCEGDINGDGAVSVFDIIEVLLAWGDDGGPADLNDDGQVNLIDLIIVILNFGECG